MPIMSKDIDDINKFWKCRTISKIFKFAGTFELLNTSNCQICRKK